MIYGMSDLHGRYDKYLEMLEKIQFSDQDEMYLIGDICDRGPESAQIYLDAKKREKVHCIMGNHEMMLLNALPNAFGFLRTDYGYDGVLDLDIWGACGGGETCASFLKVGADKVLEIYQDILSFPTYQEVDVDGKTFLLVHAGLENYERTRSIKDYAPDECVWYSLDHNSTYYPLLYDRVVVGHTPTFLLNSSRPACVFYGKGNVIDIDCGAVFEEKGGRLACLNFNTLETFYV